MQLTTKLTNTNMSNTVTSSTYNPRDNSPIKAPEKKICVTCGQPLAPVPNKFTHTMNHYVNDISGLTTVIASEEDYLTIQGVKLRRADVPKSSTAEVANE